MVFDMDSSPYTHCKYGSGYMKYTDQNMTGSVPALFCPFTQDNKETIAEVSKNPRYHIRIEDGFTIQKKAAAVNTAAAFRIIFYVYFF